jgi:hypothetical protein
MRMTVPSPSPRTEPGADADAVDERRGASHHWRARLRELYYGWSPRAVRFRYGLLLFDLLVIGFVIVSSFFFANPVVEVLDLVFGILILADFGARLLVTSRRKERPELGRLDARECTRWSAPGQLVSCGSRR